MVTWIPYSFDCYNKTVYVYACICTSGCFPISANFHSVGTCDWHELCRQEYQLCPISIKYHRYIHETHVGNAQGVVNILRILPFMPFMRQRISTTVIPFEFVHIRFFGYAAYADTSVFGHIWVRYDH